MAKYHLTIKPARAEAVAIPLSVNEYKMTALEDFQNGIVKDCPVFSDQTYQFFLRSDSEKININQVDIYINGTHLKSRYSYLSREIIPLDANELPFGDSFGYVELTCVLQLEDQTEVTLYSPFLPVYLKSKADNQRIVKMMEYVSTNYSALLSNGDNRSRIQTGFVEDGRKTLETQLILAEELSHLYEQYYGFFRANSRYHLDQEDVVQRVERIQYVTQKTVQYTAQHPEYLVRAFGNSGIPYGNEVYHPSRAMTVQNVYSRNIYENRVIVGFIEVMIGAIQSMVSEADNLRNAMTAFNRSYEGYYFSPALFCSVPLKVIETIRGRLERLLSSYDTLWYRYKDIFDFEPEKLLSRPKATDIFLSVPQYNIIFKKIYEWYNYGVYDWAQEKYMLSIINSSRLYENYVLARLVMDAQHAGFVLNESYSYDYPRTRLGRDFQKEKSLHCNTFVFYRDSIKLTLYYEPIIYGDSALVNENSVGLSRTYSWNANQRKGDHFTPDYVMKIERNGKVGYIICDAKYSNYYTVQKYRFPDLTFKYLTATKPVDAMDDVLGLNIFYGKGEEKDIEKTLYDKELSDSPISPFVYATPLFEGRDDNNVPAVDLISLLDRALGLMKN